MRARILTGIFLLLIMLFSLTVGGFATPTPDPSPPPSPGDWGDEPMPIPSPEFAPLTVEMAGQVVTFSV